jgi:ribonucleoside-diphosphate reductase beta chain
MFVGSRYIIGDLMSLLQPRAYYKPFFYPEAYSFWEQQQHSFWLVSEINMDQDIYDWKFNLNDSEREIIGNILKSFVQSEVLIGDYWRSLGGIFQHPEISMMCAAFSSMETIHIDAYAHLNTTLGLENFKEFLQDEVAMDRLNQLARPPRPLNVDYDAQASSEEQEQYWERELAVSLATFSAFGEGVALFSAFTILLSFAQRGLMRGLGEIIEFSIKDETLHSKAGVWLFNTFMSENKHIKKVKGDLYDAGRDAVQIEDSFIDSVFKENSLPNCHPDDLKEFIRQRCNNQFRAIHLKPQYRIDKVKVGRLKWFNSASIGSTHADFFASRSTNYARSEGWGDMWRDLEWRSDYLVEEKLDGKN